MTDKPKKVLVIGVGSIGERHVRCFQLTGRATISICDINAALVQQVAERYGIDQTYHDFDSALAGRHDAAVIAAPAHLHVPMARKLAEAGVHLLIEKPLSTSLDGVDELARLIAQRQLTVVIAYVLRLHPSLKQALQLRPQPRVERGLTNWMENTIRSRSRDSCDGE